MIACKKHNIENCFDCLTKYIERLEERLQRLEALLNMDGPEEDIPSVYDLSQRDK